MLGVSGVQLCASAGAADLPLSADGVVPLDTSLLSPAFKKALGLDVAALTASEAGATQLTFQSDPSVSGSKGTQGGGQQGSAEGTTGAAEPDARVGSHRRADGAEGASGEGAQISVHSTEAAHHARATAAVHALAPGALPAALGCAGAQDCTRACTRVALVVGSRSDTASTAPPGRAQSAQRASPGDQYAAGVSGSGYSKRPRAAVAPDAGGEEGVPDSTGTAKRSRLVWTSQLHKRFVDAVSFLGSKTAVPKGACGSRRVREGSHARLRLPCCPRLHQPSCS